MRRDFAGCGPLLPFQLYLSPQPFGTHLVLALTFVLHLLGLFGNLELLHGHRVRALLNAHYFADDSPLLAEVLQIDVSAQHCHGILQESSGDVLHHVGIAVVHPSEEVDHFLSD